MNCDSSPLPAKNLELDMLHEIGNRMAAADPLPEVLGRVVEVISQWWSQIRVLCMSLKRMSLFCGPPKIRIQKLSID